MGPTTGTFQPFSPLGKEEALLGLRDPDEIGALVDDGSPSDNFRYNRSRLC